MHICNEYATLRACKSRALQYSCHPHRGYVRRGRGEITFDARAREERCSSACHLSQFLNSGVNMEEIGGLSPLKRSRAARFSRNFRILEVLREIHNANFEEIAQIGCRWMWARRRRRYACVFRLDSQQNVCQKCVKGAK